LLFGAGCTGSPAILAALILELKIRHEKISVAAQSVAGKIYWQQETSAKLIRHSKQWE